MQTAPDILDAIYVPRGGVQSRITSFAAEMPSTSKMSRHLAFQVSQVRGPALAMFARDQALGPPTVLLFGESFLNSSLDDPILSPFGGGPGFGIDLVVAAPEALYIAVCLALTLCQQC